MKAYGIHPLKGQCTHVLRHTLASHCIMNGGNLLTLQRILGHQSIQMTMRYAHLSSEHLQDAAILNPLSQANKNFGRQFVDTVAWQAVKKIK